MKPLSPTSTVHYVLVVLLVGCGREEPSPTRPTPTVKVAKPLSKQTVLWDQYTGRLAATSFVEVRSRVSGYLDAVRFDEGQIVEKDQTLFVIDRRPFEAELKAASARVAEARAKLSESKSLLAAAEATKQQRVAQLKLEESRTQRAEKLSQGNAISDEEVDQRRSELLQAQANLEAANAQIEASRAAIATADAAIATAEASVETAELELQYAEIKAPIRGRISRELITPGNLVLGGVGGDANVLTTIVSLDPIYCYIDANEQAFIKYQKLERAGGRRSSRDVKNPVLMRTIGEDKFEHRGHMDFVDNRLDTDTGTIQGRAIFPNPDRELTPGQFGDLMIPGSGVIEALLIPDTAILADQSKRFVYTVNTENTIVRTEIQPGEIVDGLRHVLSGLTTDSRVVLSNLQLLRPAAKVNVEPIEIEPGEDDGLPDSYEPVPESEWLEAQN